MKVTARSYGNKFTVETKDDDLDINQVRDDVLIPLLLGLGYHQSTVNNLFFDEEPDPISGEDDV